jgi:hypothetical protein
MPSESHPVSASIVQSKVRSLLGLPPQPNLVLTYPSPLPPVGLHYPTEPVMDMGSQPDVSMSPTAFGDERDEVTYAVSLSPRPEPVDGVKNGRDEEASSIRKALPSATVGAKTQATRYRPSPWQQEADVAHQSATASDVKDTARAGADSEHVEPSGMPPERTNLNVPGISKKALSFTALPREAASTIAEQHSKQGGISPQEPAHQIAAAPTAAKNEARPPRTPPTSPSHFSPRLLEKGAPSSGNRGNFPVQPHQPAPASRAAAATLEQLRHTVRQLTVKVAAHSAQAPQDKKREPEPPPPVQHITVVNKVAKAPGGAHAFWERRYLGRLRFKGVR